MNLSALRKELSRTCSAIWALDHRRTEHIVRAMNPRADDRDVRAAFEVEEIEVEVEARIGEPQIIPGPRGGKATALVYVRGTAMYDFEYQPYVFSTALLAQRVNALANDPAVGMIVLDVDSPGGVVTGTPEAADAVYAAAKRKKVVALVNPLCASAGYWIASQASEIIAVPSADIGSIGVYQLHWDDSQFWADRGMNPEFIEAPEGGHKTEGSWFFPMSDETREYYQAEVNKIYRQFTSAVARGRGVERSVVEEGFGMGRTFMAADAKKAGLIDVVATVDAALTRLKLAPATGTQAGAALVLDGAEAYDPRADGGQVDDAAAGPDGNEGDELIVPPSGIVVDNPIGFLSVAPEGDQHPPNVMVDKEAGAEEEHSDSADGQEVDSEAENSAPDSPTAEDGGEADDTTPDGRPANAEAIARRLRLLELG